MYPLFLILLCLFIISLIGLAISKKIALKKHNETLVVKKEDLLHQLPDYKDFYEDYEGEIKVLSTKEPKFVVDQLTLRFQKFDEMKPLLHHKNDRTWFGFVKEMLLLSPEGVKKEVLLRQKLTLLQEKYGDDIGEKVFYKKPFIGMTEEMLIDSKGQPTNIEREEMKTKTKKIYIYGNKSSGDVFTFVNGECERFKEG